MPLDKEKNRAYQRRWRLENRERINEKNRRWRENNREKHRAYMRAYSKSYGQRHPEKVAEYRRRTHMNNRDFNLTRSKKYHVDHIETVTWLSLRGRCRRGGMQFDLDRNAFILWYKLQPQKCAYCDLSDLALDKSLSNGRRPIRFTIDRKDSSLPYTFGNSVFSCWRCNSAKGAEFSYDEFRFIAQKFLKPKWMKKLREINVDNYPA